MSASTFNLDPEGDMSWIQERGECMADATITEEQVELQDAPVEAQWDAAECTCPDWCERDHELD
jgi:hypothetical protein